MGAQFSRRSFLAAMAGGTASMVSRAATPSSSSRPRIGLQLFAVRSEVARDLPATLGSVAGLGYPAVEFWGYRGTEHVARGRTAAELRRLLDDHGLACCGMHHGLEALREDRLAQTVQANQTLGSPYVIVAMAREEMTSIEGIEGLAGLLNATSAQLAREDLRVGYHCHGFDFEQVDGRPAWEHLFDRTDPRVIMQLDIGNCLGGGGDPVALLKRYPGRAVSVHVKEQGDTTLESPYFAEVFRLCESEGGTAWYVVEMGGEEGMGFEAPGGALERLRRLGK